MLAAIPGVKGCAFYGTPAGADQSANAAPEVPGKESPDTIGDLRLYLRHF